ncbi:MAG TPA: hypothetical protein VFC67_15625 [Prolixibacteraceae bacterium]|nr:hypothetical protein [Prolixibacteraceae bacterium]
MARKSSLFLWHNITETSGTITPKYQLQLELTKTYAARKLESIWNLMLIQVCPVPTKIDWMA